MATRAIARRSRTVYLRRAHRRAKSMTIPLGVIAGLAPTAMFALEGFQLPGTQGGIKEAGHRLTMRMTGYEWKGGGFSGGELMKGWMPILLGVFAHKAANRLGINRALARSGVPLLRI
jgi:hypothetical protein